MIYLSEIRTTSNKLPKKYPFSIDAIKKGINLEFNSFVTFLVGENGSGKSTILEAIAKSIGFNPAGGSINNSYENKETESDLSSYLKLIWQIKTRKGFFLRTENFYSFTTYVDELRDDPLDGHNAYAPYGGKSLHEQSHGESFFSLFKNRFKKGVFILDEPEAALSPQRLLSLLSILKNLENDGETQFIIATHSPILLSYPNAVIYNLDNGLKPINYKDTEHFKVTKSFLENPELYHKILFSEL